MIYLDSGALVKLVRQESETDALMAYLDRHGGLPMVTSQLALTEVPRAIRRLMHDPHGRLAVPAQTLREALDTADSLLGSLGHVQLDEATLVAAGALDAPMLRTLDAVHLASAERLGSRLAAFVTYDKRLQGAAESVGLPVAAPTA